MKTPLLPSGVKKIDNCKSDVVMAFSKRQPCSNVSTWILKDIAVLPQATHHIWPSDAKPQRTSNF